MATEKKFIPALGYRWLTGLYDVMIRITMPEAKFRRRLIDFVAPGDQEKILEFGFGTAQNLIVAYEANSNASYSGVDIDKAVKIIAEAKLSKRQIQIDLDLYDGITLPYSDNVYDKVFSSLVFHQLDRETKLVCLRELLRVLKPGGVLIIGDWGEAKSSLMRLTFYAVQLLDGFKTTTDNVKGLLPQFIKRAGFAGVEESGFNNTSIGSYCYYVASTSRH